MVYYSLLILCAFVVLAKTAKATSCLHVTIFFTALYSTISQGGKASAYWPLTINRLKFFLPFLIARSLVPYVTIFIVFLLHFNLSNAPKQNLSRFILLERHYLETISFHKLPTS